MFVSVYFLELRDKFLPIQLSILEEEYVARKSFWRRQRHRERELSETQAKLVKQILVNYDVTSNDVYELMEFVNEGKLFIMMCSVLSHHTILETNDMSLTLIICFICVCNIFCICYSCT